MAQIAILNKYRNELGRAYRKMYDTMHCAFNTNLTQLREVENNSTFRNLSS